MKYVLIVYLFEPVDTIIFSRNWSNLEKFESKQSQSDLVLSYNGCSTRNKDKRKDKWRLTPG